MRITAIVVALAASPLLAVSAMADSHCGNVPEADWMSVAEVATAVTEAGYEVREVERDDGCYDIKAIDAQGQRLDLDVNPATGEIVRQDRDD